jgi:hypothetical protein
MGLFDFFRGGQGPVAGKTFSGKAVLSPEVNPDMAPGILPGDGQGELMLPPTMERQPGFFDRVKAKDANGMSFGDRALLALLAVNGDAGTALQLRNQMRKDTREQADRQRQNEAFKGAYRDGKFDMGAYVEALGDSGDAVEAVDIAKAFARKGGVDGGFAYTTDPMTGEVEWGEQREPSYSERLSAERVEDNEEWRDFMRDLYRQREDRMTRQGDARIGISRGNQGIAAQRESRLGSKAGGAPAGVPAPPPGFRFVRP